MSLRWLPVHALTVVLAARGYPGGYRPGARSAAWRRWWTSPICCCSMPARGAIPRGHLLAEGGRVLDVTGTGASLAEAHARAYAAVDRVDWPDGFCRRDIGGRALGLSAGGASL